MTTTPSPSLTVFGASEAVAALWSEALRRSTARRVEVIVAESGTRAAPGALANQAVREARGEVLVSVCGIAPRPSSFFHHALRTLEREPRVAFVASWLDGLPVVRDRPAQPLRPSQLLARPWFQHVPTLFRRELWQELGGFDETELLRSDLDFWLRALSAGHQGLAIEEPGLAARALDAEHPARREQALRTFERHRALLGTSWPELVLGKERLVQELFAATRELETRRMQLEREHARLSALIGRSGPA